MSKKIKDLRWFIIFVLSVVVIFLNLLIMNKTKSTPKEEHIIDSRNYYGEEFDPILLSNMNSNKYIPNEKNVLLIGINSDLDKYKKLIEVVRDKYSSKEVYIITEKTYNIKLEYRQNVYFYSDSGRPELRKNRNFSLFIDNSKISFYKCKIIPYREMILLIERCSNK